LADDITLPNPITRARSNRRNHAVAPPRQQAQKRSRLIRVIGFAHNAPPKGHGGIPTQAHFAFDQSQSIDFVARHAITIITGGFTAQRCFVHIWRTHVINAHAKLRQQFFAAGTA
jgi:hypothetical protein